MCWSASVSFATFGLGTLFNALGFAYFYRRRSSVANLVAYWQFALLMQLAEGAAWVAIDSSQSATAPSRAAMVLNVSQPYALAVAVRGWTRASFVALLFYTSIMATDAQSLWRDSATIAPRPDCRHLDLAYWDGARSVLYVLTSSTLFIGHRSTLWGTINLSIFVISFLWALAFYECGGGSLWCWSISLAVPCLVACDVALELFLGAQRATALKEARMLRLVRSKHSPWGLTLQDLSPTAD